MTELTFGAAPQKRFWQTPSPQDALRLASQDRLTQWLLYIQIISATFLQKFAIPLGAETQVYLGLPLMFGALALGLATGRLILDGVRFALFLLLIAGAVFTQLLGGHDFSIFSLCLLLVVHAPYIFKLGQKKNGFGAELKFFQQVMAIIAVLGILQYFMQFTVGWRYAFFLDGEALKPFIFQGFHALNPVGHGSHIYKSNGIFFLEPAIFSQFLAIAIIIEMLYFHSLKRIALYLTAIAVTFSGTGLLILAVLTPIFLIQQRRYLLLSFLLLILASASLWAPLMGLENLIGRASEFSNSETSGYARFFSIFRILQDFILPHIDTLLCGMGAGSFKDVTGQVNYAVHDPSWGKILFEYGLIGAFAYLPLMAHVFYNAPRIFYLKAALALQFLFLGEYILSPTVHGLIIALLAWPGEKESAPS